MGTDLETVKDHITSELKYALQCGLEREKLEELMAEITTDLRHDRLHRPDA